MDFLKSILLICLFALFHGINCYKIVGQISACPSQNSNLSLWSDPNTWGGNLPVDGSNVFINREVLLDIETPRLGQVTIEANGLLVFSPDVPLAKLTTTQILVNGELWIGSEDCPFTGNAEIFLIGMYNASSQDPNFGQKYIGVPVGGTLEMHGKKKLHWTKLSKTLLSAQNSLKAGEVILDLLDDITSWEINDQIVIASSSFDWAESEVLTVLECTYCSSNQLKVQGPIRHTHLGDIVDSVDMRAEVGLLTRNIKVHGEMQPACYANMKCNEFPYDTYGGHLKVLMGFKNVHIEGIELYDVGQQYFLGSYPLHFHMDQEVGNYEYPPYFRSNSIHKSYSRCISIHGTFSVAISNHTAYDILGHCYYLEDGSEKNTTLENNLAIGTRTASLIPSDTTDVASFFISLPMTFVRNNVAAGSDGHGFFYLFPYEPVGVSAGMGFLQPNQSLHTAIYEFSSNVAHSNAKIGFYFDHILGPNHEVKMVSNDYTPRQDPMNSISESISISFNGYTGYKNQNASAWIRGAETYFDSFMISNSGKGLVMTSSALGPKHVVNSIIHGSITFEDNVPTV